MFFCAHEEAEAAGLGDWFFGGAPFAAHGVFLLDTIHYFFCPFRFLDGVLRGSVARFVLDAAGETDSG